MTAETPYETIALERDGHIAHLTLARPELFNRIDELASSELIRAFRELQAIDGLRVVVLSAQGKHFSAGGDFSWPQRQYAEPAFRIKSADEARALMDVMFGFPVPLVTALTGYAVGLGASLVLSSDVVVASPGAGLRDPHVSIGLAACDGGTVLWPQAAGMLLARRYLLTGDLMRAEDAFRCGLVTDLVDLAEDVLPKAESIAQHIASLPPLAVQATKRALNNVTRMRQNEVIDLGLALNMAMCLNSTDLLEAIEAFKGRRPGVFTGE